MIDTWTLSLGLLSEEGEVSDDARLVMIEAAEHFLRAGGMISLAEWSTLSEESKSAFVTAGDRMRAISAYSQGIASRSRADALAMLAQADGGDAFIRALLEKTAMVAADRIQAKRPLQVST